MNLRRRPGRRAQISAELPEGLPVCYTSDWDGPFDGHTLSRDRVRRDGYELWPWQIDSDNPWWNRPLKYGEIGRTLAHLACWRDASRADADYTVMLEDDALTTPTFLDDLLTALSAPAPFDLLYLGRYPLAPNQPVNLAPSGAHGIVTPGYSHCTSPTAAAARCV